MRTSHKISDTLRKLKLIILDVDGVLTDGRIMYSESGDEIRIFDAHDGHGLVLLREAGLKTVLLSGRTSRSVRKRAGELGIHQVLQGVRDKMRAYGTILRAFSVKDEEVCYMGDDVPDIMVMKRVGISIAPRNAVDKVKAIARIVTKHSGGRGAVREVCDLILKART